MGQKKKKSNQQSNTGNPVRQTQVMNNLFIMEINCLKSVTHLVLQNVLCNIGGPSFCLYTKVGRRIMTQTRNQFFQLLPLSTWSTISDIKLLPCPSFRVSGLFWFLGEVVGGRKNILASVVAISTVHQLSIFCGHAGIVLPGPHAVGQISETC